MGKFPEIEKEMYIWSVGMEVVVCRNVSDRIGELAG
jgi:hypothetical protein